MYWVEYNGIRLECDHLHEFINLLLKLYPDKFDIEPLKPSVKLRPDSNLYKIVEWALKQKKPFTSREASLSFNLKGLSTMTYENMNANIWSLVRRGFLEVHRNARPYQYKASERVRVNLQQFSSGCD